LRDIEAEVGRALHVGVAAEDVGAGAGAPTLPVSQQQVQ
jgi:16S rRNA G527 N7-methylase RsmG